MFYTNFNHLHSLWLRSFMHTSLLAMLSKDVTQSEYLNSVSIVFIFHYYIRAYALIYFFSLILCLEKEQ